MSFIPLSLYPLYVRFFFILNFLVVIFNTLAKVNLDPLALLMLLNLHLQLLQPLQVLQLLNEVLVRFLSTVAQNALDNRIEDLADAPPRHRHHHQHDQVEQC